MEEKSLADYWNHYHHQHQVRQQVDPLGGKEGERERESIKQS